MHFKLSAYSVQWSGTKKKDSNQQEVHQSTSFPGSENEVGSSWRKAIDLIWRFMTARNRKIKGWR